MSALTCASLEMVSGHRVAVALSGGADSVALTLWLTAQADRWPDRVTVAGVIHVNHQLRGAESDRDEAFCRALAKRLGLPIDVRVAPVTSAPTRSPEAPARAVRYRAFAEAAEHLQATRVVTAHTADDQAETVLLRALRGAATRGISGIRPVRGLYARPFLACRREELRRWLTQEGEAWCEDSTNADRVPARNRIRHELLPVVESMAPGGVMALARLALLADDDERVLEALAIENASSVVLKSDPEAVVLDRAGFAALPAALARRVLRRVCEGLEPEAAWRGEHFEAVRRLAERDAGGGSLDLPGIRVERVSNELRVVGSPAADTVAFAYPLTVPGRITVPEVGLEISARLDASDRQAATYVLQVPMERRSSLTVRNRRPGDRVALRGGTRKIQDLMVDAKIPRSQRDRLPLLVAGESQVLWVGDESGVGTVAVDTSVRAGTAGLEGSGDMVVLSIRKLERT